MLAQVRHHSVIIQKLKQFYFLFLNKIAKAKIVIKTEQINPRNGIVIKPKKVKFDSPQATLLVAEHRVKASFVIPH